MTNPTPQENNPVNTVKTGESRTKQGKFVKGKSGNPKGLTPLTEEQKLDKKAEKIALEQRITEYKESLGDALPLISPVLIAKAIGGDIQAIKEINAVVVEKGSTKIDVNIKGAIAHGHFHVEDDKVEEEIIAKYKLNMRERIKTLPNEKDNKLIDDVAKI